MSIEERNERIRTLRKRYSLSNQIRHDPFLINHPHFMEMIQALTDFDTLLSNYDEEITIKRKFDGSSNKKFMKNPGFKNLETKKSIYGTLRSLLTDIIQKKKSENHLKEIYIRRVYSWYKERARALSYSPIAPLDQGVHKFIDFNEDDLTKSGESNLPCIGLNNQSLLSPMSKKRKAIPPMKTTHQRLTEYVHLSAKKNPEALNLSALMIKEQREPNLYDESPSPEPVQQKLDFNAPDLMNASAINEHPTEPLLTSPFKGADDNSVEEDHQNRF